MNSMDEVKLIAVFFLLFCFAPFYNVCLFVLVVVVGSTDFKQRLMHGQILDYLF